MGEVTLAECPIGLFVSADGELCVKTEYGGHPGPIQAYIVSSGEFFWGAQPQTVQSQWSQMVRPVTDEEVAAFVASLSHPEPRDG